MANVIGIMSWNVNGLGDVVKRKRVMMKLKKERNQIYFLQETHMTKEEHVKLKKFGYRNVYFSSFNGGRKRGVIILISNTVTFEFEREIKDKEGRYIIVLGRLDSEPVTLVNIYAPPESDRSFYTNMFNTLATVLSGVLIMGGDTNVVLNEKKDCTSLNRSKKHIAKCMNTTLQEMGLVDIWRNMHPEEKGYTHHSAAHKTHSRIDQLFVRKEDVYRVRQCRIGAADVSDHNPLFLRMVINNRKRQTLWRFNVGILNSEKRKEEIGNEIKTYIKENDNGEVDPTIVWDTMKAVIRGSLIARMAQMKKAKLIAYNTYEEKLRKLEKEYQTTNCEETHKQIKEVKANIKIAQLDEIERNNRYMKQNYYEAGTKATKLLARRIRKQQEMSNVCRIKDPDTEEVVTDPAEIEKIFQKHYETLYTEPEMPEEEEMAEYLEQLDLPSIGRMQNAIITAKITAEEVMEAISSFKNGKSPGSDGLPIEYYKAYKKELVPILVASYNWTLNKHKIPPSWSEAIITVIHKQGRNKELCGSYRPISMLNVDYKIYTKIIANRLAKITDDMIEEEQTGFIVGRQTHDNIRRAIHIVEQAHRTKTSTLVVSIDAEAAYDRVSWRFLYAVLRRFGFNEEAIHCVKSLYQHPTARVKVNGSLSNRFELYRSARQGCALSPTLFTYFIEPLAQAVRQHEGIRGVMSGGGEHKIGLFADDVITFLERPDESLPVLDKIIREFGRFSGYKINITKTQVLTLNYKPKKEIQEAFKFNWNQKSIKYLGVNITKHISTLFEANYGKINQEINKDIERWSTLPLELSSRLEAVKMNILPRLLYLFQALPIEVPAKQFTTWDRQISRFIWAGKRARIRFKTLQLPKEGGGWGLPHLEKYYHAAQLRYIGCWCDETYIARWKDMERRSHGHPIQNLLGDVQSYKKSKLQLDPIIKFTLDIWYKIVKKYKLENDIKILKWVAYDSKFEPARQEKKFRQWGDRGMTAWCTLMVGGRLPTYEELGKKYGLDNKEFFMYLQLRDYYNKEIQRKDTGKMNGVVQLMIHRYNGYKFRMVSEMYQQLMGNEKHSTEYIKEKWEKEMEIEITSESWAGMWTTHHSSTNSRIWREFAWKNLSRYFITPKIKSRQIQKQMGCWRECGEANADHTHVFWKCTKIQSFWEMMNIKFRRILGYGVPLEGRIWYLGDLEGGTVQEKDKYLVKMLLTACKKMVTRLWGQTQTPTFEAWVVLVEELYVMERMTHGLRLQMELFEKRWEKWMVFKMIG